MSEFVPLHSFQSYKSETEYLRRKNNQAINQEKRKRTIRVKGLHIALIFLMLIITAFFSYRLITFVMTWEKLKVKTFVLKSKPVFRGKELENILRQYNVNILTINFENLRNKLLTLKEVEDVSLNRKLPSTVEITFLLRKPVFQLAINGKYNIMDAEGILLNINNERDKNLIEIKNVATTDVARLSSYIEELNGIKSALDYVSYAEPYGIALKLKNEKELFYPGETNFAKKIGHYMKLKTHPELKSYCITTVDLRFDDRLYFEYEDNQLTEKLQSTEKKETEAIN